MKLPQKENWFLWKDGEHAPGLNMSLDESLIFNTLKFKLPLLRIYNWDRPSVSIGYIQKYSAAPHSGYSIVRRPTGGGVVFHDNDFTYTVIVPTGHWIEKLNRTESYHIFHRSVISALKALNITSELAPTSAYVHDRATMQCFSSPTRYDVIGTKMLEGVPGTEIKKFAGAAQRRTKTGILHQGSIAMSSINSTRGKVADTLIRSFTRDLDITFSSFIPGNELMQQAVYLAQNKYDTNEWNRRR